MRTKSSQYIATSLMILSLLLTCSALQCPTHCISCSDSITCTQCETGYFLDANQVCVICPMGCTSCQLDNSMIICQTCESGYQRSSDKKCFTCSPFCGDQGCSENPKNCINCRFGFTQAEDNSCYLTEQDKTVIRYNFTCLEINEDNPDICDKCRGGHFSAMGQCHPCDYPSTYCDFPLETLYNECVGNITDIVDTLNNQLNISIPEEPTELQKQYVVAAYYFWEILLSQGVTLNQTIQFLNGNQTKDVLDLTFYQCGFAIYEGLVNKTKTELLDQMMEFYIMDIQHKECMYGYGVVDSKCGKCQAENCLACQENLCSACEDGHYLDSETNLCIICSETTEFCDVCSESGQCVSCLAPYSLSSNNTCQRCEEPCATCLNSECQTCIRPFSYYPDTSGQCFRCSTDSCKICIKDQPQICLECIKGFYLKNGTCSRCKEGCSICSNNDVCIQCLPGFAFSTEGSTDWGTCVPKMHHPGCIRCAQYNMEICIQCQKDYFLDEMGQCRFCEDSRCSVYDSQGVCQALEYGSTIFEKKPVSCREGCKFCQSSDPEICLECMPGFWLDGSICAHCGDFCKKCTDKNTCDECLIFTSNQGDGSCESCPQHCLTCEEDTCLTCTKSYNLINGICQHKCQEDTCLVCDSQNPQICHECQPGYSLFENSCIRCELNCTGYCDSANISSCLSQSFRYIQYELEQQDKCSDNCWSCDIDKCFECYPGYKHHKDRNEPLQSLFPNANDENGYDYDTCTYLEETMNTYTECRRICAYPCLQCDEDQCLQCDTGFLLQNKACFKDLTISEGFCPVLTYKLNETSCELCPDNCLSCDEEKCFTCTAKYYESNGECLACSTGCLTCTSAKICQSCPVGYYLTNIYGLERNYNFKSGQCKPCSQSCKTCLGDSEWCTSCPEDTQISGFLCKSNTYVSFQIEFDVEYKDFLEEGGSQKIAKTLSKNLEISEGKILIRKIREGSTILQGQISMADETQATESRDKLKSLAISDYPVLSSSYLVNDQEQTVDPIDEEDEETNENQEDNENDNDNDDQNDDEDQHDDDDDDDQKHQDEGVGIIVGCIIGGIILLAIIIYAMIRCRRPNKGSTPEQKYHMTPGSAQSQSEQAFEMN